MKNKLIIISGFVALCILIASGTSVLALENDQVSITFIDVGQGDAILIRDSLGFDVLIDGGRTSAGPTVLAFLRDQEVDDIDVMVATHADDDHIGGLIDVLKADDIPVEKVLYNGYPGTTQTWEDFAAAVASEGLTLETANFPDMYSWGNVSAHVLNPVSGLSDPEQNEASVVILLDNADIEILLTGDIGEITELDVAGRGIPYWSGPACCAEVLKVAHHGSKNSTSTNFLLTVQPEDAVISVGSNPYGHPAPETLDRLTTAGATIWRTDEYGTILVVTDGGSYFVQLLEQLFKVFFPMINSNAAQASTDSPIFTETPQPTATMTTPQPTAITPSPQPSLTPSPTNTLPPSTTGNVMIVDIFADGAGSTEPDEYVTIRNDDTNSIQLQNWTLMDNADHTFTFPVFTMQPGQVCRVYTNEDHPEWCGFNYDSASAIWNNTGDCAYLRDSSSILVTQFCY